MFQLERAGGWAELRAGQGGFTMVELMIALVVFAFMLALGVPNMSKWVLASKARSASEFYVDGFARARREAVAHNARSRIVLSPNVGNGQMDWQIDLCFPVPGTPCSQVSGVWSTPATAAPNDPQGAAGYKSVLRGADALPQSDALVPTLTPEGSSEIYYTELGWVDTGFAQRLSRLQLAPSTQLAAEVPTVALVVTLAGLATKCDPTVPAGDSRGCPP
ncbi:Tfp pilus assembly protein FimT/FimU [Rugamonas sp. CCM 8940]|uniref:pilus assembly FimT family protein n=1 Tax=Rugamonas sp. CCM 8940 TaxID=2765359 RepID=UPI0018F3F1C0|nr:prepilin-type N-terminal cleavage/methylation domain-containing protein [Rugamonas sp. CCM 8940]MBJ7310644.1 prepilin-type N-terminal cleavage/methylation domain-containing protein [Rugamonas sp. CCM 8940]